MAWIWLDFEGRGSGANSPGMALWQQWEFKQFRNVKEEKGKGGIGVGALQGSNFYSVVGRAREEGRREEGGGRRGGGGGEGDEGGCDACSMSAFLPSFPPSLLPSFPPPPPSPSSYSSYSYPPPPLLLPSSLLFAFLVVCSNDGNSKFKRGKAVERETEHRSLILPRRLQA